MIGYAARTTNRRNLKLLRDNDWRLLLSPLQSWTTYGMRYALDNGAWTAHVTGQPWNEKRFFSCLKARGRDADFVVLPDIVGGGVKSFERSHWWLPVVADYTPLPMLPAQDGFIDAYVSGMIGPGMGLFVGGTTAWKEKTMAHWAALARATDALCHVGRVNTVRRIALCAAAGADSFDGSAPSRYAVEFAKLDLARRQPDLLVTD
jgi:hypothetical protein